MTELVYLPAAEALYKFHLQEVSPVGLLEATVARAEGAESQISALIGPMSAA